MANSDLELSSSSKHNHLTSHHPPYCSNHITRRPPHHLPPFGLLQKLENVRWNTEHTTQRRYRNTHHQVSDRRSISLVFILPLLTCTTYLLPNLVDHKYKPAVKILWVYIWEYPSLPHSSTVASCDSSAGTSSFPSHVYMSVYHRRYLFELLFCLIADVMLQIKRSEQRYVRHRKQKANSYSSRYNRVKIPIRGMIKDKTTLDSSPPIEKPSKVSECISVPQELGCV